MTDGHEEISYEQIELELDFHEMKSWLKFMSKACKIRLATKKEIEEWKTLRFYRRRIRRYGGYLVFISVNNKSNTLEMKIQNGDYYFKKILPNVKSNKTITFFLPLDNLVELETIAAICQIVIEFSFSKIRLKVFEKRQNDVKFKRTPSLDYACQILSDTADVPSKDLLDIAEMGTPAPLQQIVADAVKFLVLPPGEYRSKDFVGIKITPKLVEMFRLDKKHFSYCSTSYLTPSSECLDHFDVMIQRRPFRVIADLSKMEGNIKFGVGVNTQKFVHKRKKGKLPVQMIKAESRSFLYLAPAESLDLNVHAYWEIKNYLKGRKASVKLSDLKKAVSWITDNVEEEDFDTLQGTISFRLGNGKLTLRIKNNEVPQKLSFPVRNYQGKPQYFKMFPPCFINAVKRVKGEDIKIAVNKPGLILGMTARQNKELTQEYYFGTSVIPEEKKKTSRR